MSVEVTPGDYLSRLGTGADVAPVAGLPPFTGGAVGYVGFDAVPLFGDVKFRAKPRLLLPEIYFLTFDRILAFDHRNQTLSLIQNARIGESQDPNVLYRQVQEQLLDLYDSVSDVKPLEVLPVPTRSTELPPDLLCNFSAGEFADAVRKVKEYIRAGDIFQGVLSRRFSLPARGMDPFDLYRVLRFLNPSPYMFLLDFGSFQVVGASPEALVRSDGSSVEVRPIAGTRKRGDTEEEDRALEKELLNDPKDRAEHVMLVDLGRNDVGRVAEYGSVEVSEFMAVEKFSHVMHIVSRVVGKLRPGLDRKSVV